MLISLEKFQTIRRMGRWMPIDFFVGIWLKIVSNSGRGDNNFLRIGFCVCLMQTNLRPNLLYCNVCTEQQICIMWNKVNAVWNPYKNHRFQVHWRLRCLSFTFSSISFILISFFIYFLCYFHLPFPGVDWTCDPFIDSFQLIIR